MLRSYSSLGDVFTFYLVGKRMTFVTNAHIIPTITKLEAHGTLSNFPTRFEIIPMIFGDGVCRRDIVQSYWGASNETAHVWALFHGKNLEPLTRRFQLEFNNRMESSISKTEEWQTSGLLELIASLFLPTTTRLFFGSNTFFQSREYLDIMFTFNDNVNALQKGKHPNSNPIFVDAKRKLLKAILAEESTDDPPFEAVQVLLQGMETSGFNDNEKATTLLSILWASNMNAIVSAFWALWYILHDSDASKAIQQELKRVTWSSSTPRNITSPRNINTPRNVGTPRSNNITTTSILSLEQLKQMVVAESACLEAMRMSSANILRTEAMSECDIKTPKGDTYHVRKGDHVAISTGQIHYDPATFPDPEKYKYNRFIVDGGRRCNSTNVMVFSHGKHMCPGRFLAMNELKLLLVSIFTRLEIEFIIPQPEPELDLTYYGVGSMKPKTDVRVQYRRRW